MKKCLRPLLCLVLLLSFLAAGSSQGKKSETLPEKVWLVRAQSLTDELLYDAPRMDRYDRSLVWARMADIWWKTDPQQARGWFLKAIEVLELHHDDEKSSACRLMTARTILAMVATRDKSLHQRLISIIGANKQDQSDLQRQENATALANVGLSLVASDPESAAKFGEESLRLGFSLPIASLLWKLRARDPSSAEKLFMQTLQVAYSTRDINCVSALVAAAFQGPYTTENYQKPVLSLLADDSERADICKLDFLLSPLLAAFDALSREQSQKVRAMLAACRQPESKPTDRTNDKSSDKSGPVTIDELLSAAADAANQSDRDYFLMKAVHLAAEKKDFPRAISILDSIGTEDRQRLKTNWDSLRWDYAAEAACGFLGNNDRTAAMKFIEATPPHLKGIVNVTLAINCKAANAPQVLEFMEAGRMELEKADKSEQPATYLSLVRQYAKYWPAEAPAVLGEAVASINRAPDEKSGDCDSGQRVSPVLSTQMILNWYRLPATLLDVDDVGVRNAVARIQPADKRAAARLQLLKAALDQNQIALPKSYRPKNKMRKPFLSWIKINRAIVVQCIALFLLSITVTIVITRWRHKSIATTEGFDFSARRDQSSSGPRIGEMISLKIPRGEDGRSLAEAAGNSSLYMIAVVDPNCPACKAAESEMSGISQRLSSSGIPYFLIMLTDTNRTTQFFEYADSIGLRSHALVWRTDETEAPPSLSEMVIPSHLLVSREGLVVDKWPGTHQSPTVRQKMINQITADAISHLPH